MSTFAGRVEALVSVPAGAEVVATNSGGGPTTVTLPAGDYFLTAAGSLDGLIAELGDQLNATRPPSSGSWSVTLDPTTGRVTINCPGTWSLSFTSTPLRDLLGFAGDIAGAITAQTGTKQAKGLWRPNCPLNLAGRPQSAPKVTDLAIATSGTGRAYAVIGTDFLHHRDVVWSHVPRASVWEAEASLANASWQTFLDDTQYGDGHPWFEPSSLVQIYDHAGILVGQDVNAGAGVDGWTMYGVESCDPNRVENAPWTMFWRIEIPELVAEVPEPLDDGAPTWTVDATSGKGLPAGATEWAAALAAAGISSGGPSMQWDCATASGPVPDLIGAFTGTSTLNAGDFAQAVTGWSAKGFLCLASSVRNVSNSSSSLPNIGSASCLLIGYVSFPATAAAMRSVITMGPTFGAQVAANVTTTPRLQGLADPNSVNGTASPMGAVRPIVVQVNRTAGTAFICSDAEKLTPTLNATPTGKKIWCGGDNVQTWSSAGTVHLMLVGFFNAAAELSQTQIKALLQTLGWTVAWS